MTTIKYTCTAILSLLFAACSSAPSGNNSGSGKTPAYQVLIIKKNEQHPAWGYVIMRQNRQLIKQFTIPAMEGNQPFSCKQQALLVGNLVAYKMNHSLHPSVSKKELDSLGIIPLQNDTLKKQTSQPLPADTCSELTGSL